MRMLIHAAFGHLGGERGFNLEGTVSATYETNHLGEEHRGISRGSGRRREAKLAGLDTNRVPFYGESRQIGRIGAPSRLECKAG